MDPEILQSHRMIITVRPVLDIALFFEISRIDEHHQIWVDVVSHGCHDLDPIFLTCFPALSEPRTGVIIHLLVHVLSCCIGLRVDLWTLQRRHNERDGVSNHRRFHCLLNRLFRRRSNKTSKLRVTGLCEGWPVDSPHKGPVTSKMFPCDDVIMKDDEHTGIKHKFVASRSVGLFHGRFMRPWSQFKTMPFTIILISMGPLLWTFYDSYVVRIYANPWPYWLITFEVKQNIFQ